MPGRQRQENSNLEGLLDCCSPCKRRRKNADLSRLSSDLDTKMDNHEFEASLAGYGKKGGKEGGRTEGRKSVNCMSQSWIPPMMRDFSTVTLIHEISYMQKEREISEEQRRVGWGTTTCVSTNA